MKELRTETGSVLEDTHREIPGRGGRASGQSWGTGIRDNSAERIQQKGRR